MNTTENTELNSYHMLIFSNHSLIFPIAVLFTFSACTFYILQSSFCSFLLTWAKPTDPPTPKQLSSVLFSSIGLSFHGGSLPFPSSFYPKERYCPVAMSHTLALTMDSPATDIVILSFVLFLLLPFLHEQR